MASTEETTDEVIPMATALFQLSFRNGAVVTDSLSQQDVFNVYSVLGGTLSTATDQNEKKYKTHISIKQTELYIYSDDFNELQVYIDELYSMSYLRKDQRERLTTWIQDTSGIVISSWEPREGCTTTVLAYVVHCLRAEPTKILIVYPNKEKMQAAMQLFEETCRAMGLEVEEDANSDNAYTTETSSTVLFEFDPLYIKTEKKLNMIIFDQSFIEPSSWEVATPFYVQKARLIIQTDVETKDLMMKKNRVAE
jgi:hypothetical protein